MLNFPPPPPPPIEKNQLENLANYYRQLIDYYRRAGDLASQQLAHVEALLYPNAFLAFGSSDDVNGCPEKPSTNGSKQKAIASSLPQLLATAHGSIPQTTPEEPPLAIEERHLNSGEDASFETDEESRSQTDSQEMELLARSLESNRGKILHLDYLIRKLYVESDLSELESATEVTRSYLEKGAAQQLWFAVPDSPDCWTIDLSEFPDLSEELNLSKKKQPHPPRTTLVGSERLDRYPTVMDALAACLAEHYPNSMTTKQIADWFYPDKLSHSRREKVRTALGKALSAGCDRYWRRVRVGEYIHLTEENEE
jgi:hypothetical protein